MANWRFRCRTVPFFDENRPFRSFFIRIDFSGRLRPHDLFMAGVLQPRTLQIYWNL